jgi:gamma-glutamylcyclotransferase (GGCT)/AIG2-like uncharacterized protein YtfP
MKIKGHLYDLGRFPGWRYETWGWVHGTILRVPLQFRAKFVQHCDALEGDAFERRLVIAYNEDENTQDIVWAYHYSGKTNVSQRVQDGSWKGSNNFRETGVGEPTLTMHPHSDQTA